MRVTSTSRRWSSCVGRYLRHWLMFLPPSSPTPPSPSPPPSQSQEVIQEGWYFLASNPSSPSSTKKSNTTLYECWYQIYSDGLLAFHRNTNFIYQLSIPRIQFKLYDATPSLATGCGLILSYPSPQPKDKEGEGPEEMRMEEYYCIFDHILDLKRFCFGCYRTTHGENLHVSFIILSTSLLTHLLGCHGKDEMAEGISRVDD